MEYNNTRIYYVSSYSITIQTRGFVEFQSCGLSNFAEQTGEAIHAKFKPTWARFKILEEHPDHADRLLKAFMDIGGRKIS